MSQTERRKISAVSLVRGVKQHIPVRKLSVPAYPVTKASSSSPKSNKLLFENGKLVEKMRKQSIIAWRRISFAQTVSSNSEDTENYSWTSCQQVIMRILHGEKVGAEERTKVANSINDLASDSLAPLLTDFYKNQLLPQSMQDLLYEIQDAKSSKEKVDKLLEIWTPFFLSILPDITSILYPLEISDARFNVKAVTLAAFRDLVLLKTVPLVENIENFLKHNGSAYRMLVILEFTTRNVQEHFEEFEKLFYSCIPVQTIVPLNEDISLRQPKPKFSKSFKKIFVNF